MIARLAERRTAAQVARETGLHRSTVRDLARGRALDLLGVGWTRPTTDHVSVARRACVALLDQHVGPTS